MKIVLAQVNYRFGDFGFNFNKIVKNIKDADLTIFPSITDFWAENFVDENYQTKMQAFFKDLAITLKGHTVLVGTILVKNGVVSDLNKKILEILGKNVYIADEFVDNIDCDLYILSKNSYFVEGGKNTLIDNITTMTNFVYVNSVMLKDENVFCGESFIKNSKNELVDVLPLCEEKVLQVSFDKNKKNKEHEEECRVEKVLEFALREYCGVVGFKKVILGLSGGIDSALVATLAVKAVGSENVLGVMLPSMFSSNGSIEDSLELAKNLNIKTEKMSIIPMFDKFMAEFERKYDLAEENLQARLRGLILMFLSNRDGYLLLTTGNKSELAMGYGTLYGDMAGGLNIIADLTKTKVYRLANFLNKEKELIPQNIIDKAPSAELRENQKDQDTLPEYDILDDIIELYFEKKETLENIYKKYDKFLVDDIVKRVYRAEFKRRQACLGIRITENAFCSNLTLPIVQKLY